MMIEGRYHCEHGVDLTRGCIVCRAGADLSNIQKARAEANLAHSTVYQKAVSRVLRARQRALEAEMWQSSGMDALERSRHWNGLIIP